MEDEQVIVGMCNCELCQYWREKETPINDPPASDWVYENDQD